MEANGADGKETRAACGYPLLWRDSCSGEKQEGCRNSHVETALTGLCHSNCTDEPHRRLGHSTRTLARHSWAVFLSKFEMHNVRFAMIKKGRSIFTRLDYLASSVGCFVSVSFIRSFFACQAFCSPPFVLSFFFFAYWIEPVINRGQW